MVVAREYQGTGTECWRERRNTNTLSVLESFEVSRYKGQDSQTLSFLHSYEWEEISFTQPMKEGRKESRVCDFTHIYPTQLLCEIFMMVDESLKVCHKAAP